MKFTSLIARFNKLYAKTGSFWSVAPSNPDAAGLFSDSAGHRVDGAKESAIVGSMASSTGCWVGYCGGLHFLAVRSTNLAKD